MALSNKRRVAGSDTVTISLTGTLWNMLKTPGASQKLAAEIRQNIPLGQVPDYASISKLPYLDGCLKEGMRMTTPFSGPMPRISPPGGMDINGVTIPPGTHMLVMHSHIHHDERIFANPWDFKPERWSASNATEIDRFFLGV